MASGNAEELEAMKARVRAFAEGLAASAAPNLELTVSTTSEEADGLTVAFNGPDAKYMVGRNGQTLDALQLLVGQMINKRGAARLRVLFDADDYRVRREATLRQIAEDLAAQVVATGQEAVLDPLSPLERRIIHQVLSENSNVRTYSEGEEPERYIIISPA